MAKYRYTCNSCAKTVEKYASLTQEFSCQHCGSPLTREFPNLGSKKVTEVVDSFTNIRHEDDHKKQLEDRRTEYFWDVEVPRLVQTYSTETCLQEGWLVYNEKGELVIGKPSKKKK
jgi:hypothetical protein